MSDFDHPLPPSPPPPPGFPPAPSTPFGAPAAAAPPPGWGGPPAAGGYPLPAFSAKPERPPVVAGALLLILGGALMVVGSFLNWMKVDAEMLPGFGLDLSFNGFGGEDGETKDGPVFVFLSIVLVAFGITMLAARKVLAVAILSVVVAVLALLAAAVDVADVRSSIDDLKELDAGFTATMGPGLWVVLAGAVVSVAGGIATLVVRRKP